MSKLKDFWAAADIKKRAIIIFISVIVAYIGVYTVGDLTLYVVKPTSNQYLVARTNPSDIKDVDIKKSTDVWSDPSINAKNVSKQKLTVGQQISVQRYWWFGSHTFVKDVVLK